MKLKLSFLLLFAFCAIGRAQSLVLTNILVITPLFNEACTHPNKGIIAEAQYTNSIQAPTNKFFYPVSNRNVITMTYTNPNVVVSINSLFGQSKCGFGSATLTNIADGDKFAFALLYPTNVGQPPTNQLVPVTVTGVRTNSP